MTAVAKAVAVAATVAVAVTAAPLLERRMKERCLDVTGRCFAGCSRHAAGCLQADARSLMNLRDSLAAMKPHLL